MKENIVDNKKKEKNKIVYLKLSRQNGKKRMKIFLFYFYSVFSRVAKCIVKVNKPRFCCAFKKKFTSQYGVSGKACNM